MMEAFQFACVLAGCLLVVQFPASRAFPSGAPNRACLGMTPLHRGQFPQTSTPPYAIRVEQTSYTVSQRISVTIYASCGNELFQGFMIQARRVDINSNRDEQIGFFNIPPGTRAVTGCGLFAQAITHQSQNDKSTITFDWEAPAQPEGDLVIVATFLKSYTTFWAKLYSNIIQDSSSSVRANPGSVVYPTPSLCQPEPLPDPPRLPTTTTPVSTTTTTTQFVPTTSATTPAPITTTTTPAQTTTRGTPSFPTEAPSAAVTQPTTTRGARTLPFLTTTPPKSTPKLRTTTTKSTSVDYNTTGGNVTNRVSSTVSLQAPNSRLVVFFGIAQLCLALCNYR